jgi:hypothetical protein
MDMGAVRYTAAEMDAMTPAERAAALEATPLIRDLSQVPPAYQPRIEAMRQRLAERLARQEQRPAS